MPVTIFCFTFNNVRRYNMSRNPKKVGERSGIFWPR